MRRDDLANSLARRRPGIDCTPDCRYVSTHNRGDETSVDLFPTDEANIRRLNHRVSRFDHRHQPTTFDHSECFRHASLLLCLFVV
jgi:hypothetical protein